MMKTLLLIAGLTMFALGLGCAPEDGVGTGAGDTTTTTPGATSTPGGTATPGTTTGDNTTAAPGGTGDVIEP